MTVARTFTIDGAGRLSVPAMLTGYALMLLAAWAFSRACRANVAKDRTIAEACDERDQALAHGDELRAERDHARQQWAAWYIEAETRRDQGPPLVRRIHYKATAGKGTA